MTTILVLGLGITWFLGCIIYLIYFSSLFNPQKIRESLKSYLKKLDDFEIEYKTFKSEKQVSTSEEDMKNNIKKLDEIIDKLVKALEEADKSITRNKRAFTEKMVSLIKSIFDEVKNENLKIKEIRIKIEAKLESKAGIPPLLLELIDNFIISQRSSLKSILSMIPEVGGGTLPKGLKIAGFVISIILVITANLLFFKVI
jgi:hypothetical protein